MNMSTPVRSALIGAVGGLLAFVLMHALDLESTTPWWALVIALAIGGYIGGLIRVKRGKK
jgi:hypothetical protein